MQHFYEEKIERALCYLKDPGHLSPTGNSPIVAVVYDPLDAVEMRSYFDNVLVPKAKYHDFNVHALSLGNILTKYIENHRLSRLWSASRIREQELYDSIRQEVVNNRVIENAILEFQESLREDPQALIVLTDLEMLHPFILIGAVENQIYTKVTTPILVLYPGKSQGVARSFLGIYNQDGNYRTVNF